MRCRSRDNPDAEDMRVIGVADGKRPAREDVIRFLAMTVRRHADTQLLVDRQKGFVGVVVRAQHRGRKRVLARGGRRVSSCCGEIGGKKQAEEGHPPVRGTTNGFQGAQFPPWF